MEDLENVEKSFNNKSSANENDETVTSSNSTTFPVQVEGDKYICVLDFEANCAKDMRALKMDNEIIEFPSVLWRYNENSTPMMTFVSEFQMFCKPKNTPILTPFCIELTKITQDQVDNGVPFPIALQEHENWLRNHIPNFDAVTRDRNVIIVTCGEWDMKTMAPKEYRNYGLNKINSVYLRYVNAKYEFCELYFKRKQRIGMEGMLNHLRIRLEGTHHSGIDDCRNISKIVVKMVEDGLRYEDLTVLNVML